jgi:ATP-dependent Clp protease protease subunit
MPNRESFKLCFDLRMSADEEAEIMIYGRIVTSDWKWNENDVSAVDFDKALKKAKSAKRVKLRINSPGGNVYQAVAMRSMLAGAGFKDLNIYVEGLCASAATLLACIPGAKAYMAEGSHYMLHNPWTVVMGNAAEMEHEAKVLRGMEGDFRAMYAKKCGGDDETIKAWMDDETWFTAKEAQENGFIDEITEAPEAVAACVDPRMMEAMKGMYKHVPDGIAVKDEAVAVTETAPPPVSTDDPTNAAGASTEDKTHEEETKMTLEELKAAQPELYASIVRGGEEAERTRMQDIDALTPAGYEAMAAEAKTAGTSSMEYHKKIVAAQREKAQKFTENRATETAAATAVAGGASDDADANATAQAEDKNAAEIAGYAKAYKGDDLGGMY